MTTKELQIDIVRNDDLRRNDDIVLSGRMIEWILTKTDKINEKQRWDNEDVETYVKTYWPLVIGSSIMAVTFFTHLFS